MGSSLKEKSTFMKTSSHIIVAVICALITAILGAFIFWSCGVKWIPGEQLGRAVTMTILGSITVAIMTYIGTAPNPYDPR